jgi:putative membrane-bound dehydrogenase-like protein
MDLMHMIRMLILAAGVLLSIEIHSRTVFAQPPKVPKVPNELSPKIESLQPGVTLTLIAEHPALVTPIGIDVDAQNNIFLVSSNTHFRPVGYVGPEHDEVLKFDREGRNRKVFYAKTDKTMHVKVGSDGWLYLAERNRILRVKDTNDDGAGDLEETLVWLDTVSDYPHNGLSGMAWHPDGELVFSLGENFGERWTLQSKDGVKLTGRGEGGVFRCRTDGTEMRRIAKGFWNPFGLWVRADGETFAVDNDPGSRPPCRLLNIIEGADYGFQWVYGKTPVHPFVCWNGELRGTLPMIHPSGEAPSALVPLGGGVLVPSWSNHCIDYFPLVRKDAGYTSQRIEILRGGEYFRPTGIAQGPDGAYYMTDWVFSSYELHGRGRLWKLEIDLSMATWVQNAIDPVNHAASLAKAVREGNSKLSIQQLFDLASGSDAYLADAALTAIALQSTSWTIETLKSMSDDERVWALVALRRVDLMEEKWVRALLLDANPEVRFECLRWIADAVLTDFSDDVELMLTQPDLNYRLFEAALATWNTLRGKPGAGVTDEAVLMERVTNTAIPARLRGFALRLLPTSHPKLVVPLLQELIAAGDSVLSLEAVRTLVARGGGEAHTALAEIAEDETQNMELRAEAIVGLSTSVASEHHALLLDLAANGNEAVRNESLRALRSSKLEGLAKQSIKAVSERHPESASLAQALLDPDSINIGRPGFAETTKWLNRLEAVPGKANVAAGRRLFFHPRLALCASCHRHQGRGSVVGPDLSLVARGGTPTAILQSVLEPSREIAPQYFHQILLLSDGSLFNGILLRSSSIDVYRDSVGRERVFQKDEIEECKESKVSLMPEGLTATLTDSELRDLLAFLQSETNSQ